MPAPPQPTLQLSATVDGCGPASVYDTGTIIYLLASRNCSDKAGLTASVTASLGDTQSVYRWSFPGFNQEVSKTDLPGTKRNVSVHRRGSWRSFPNDDSWGWRDGAGLLVNDGKLFLLGGYRAGEGNQNEVWSSYNVHQWQLLNAEAPWTGRHGAAWVVHRNRLFVISGDLNDDVWSSNDGVEWHQDVLHAPFGKRYTPNAVSDGNRIIFYAGQYWEPYDWCAFQPECAAVGFNDIWASADGKSWSEINHAAPWPGRGLIHGAAYFNNRIYLVGGGLKVGPVGHTVAETVKEFSDIWSSADGVNWRLEANTLGFTPRTHFSLISTPHGCFVSDGSVGLQGNFSNDVFFAPDCVKFAPIPDAPPMQKRHASSAAYFNGSLVILGGPPYAGPETTAGTQIWQYFPDL